MSIFKFTILTAVAAMSMAAATASAATVLVTPSNLGDWALYSSDSSGAVNTGSATAELVNGPAAPPLGTGSALLTTLPGPSNGSAQLRSHAYAGTKLADLTSLSYSTYVTQWNGAQAPYLTLWLDTDNNGSADDRIHFEPVYSEADAGNGNANPQADVALNVWQTWNVLTGMIYDDGPLAGPGSNAISFAAYVAAKPDATIVNPGGLGGIRIASGFVSGSDIEAYVDNFTIGTALGSTTYNFEAVPEPGTIALVGLVTFGLVGVRRRRK